MAEFCLECFNQLNGTAYTEDEAELEVGLCEGCGEVKPVVVQVGRPTLLWWCRNFLDAILWHLVWKHRR